MQKERRAHKRREYRCPVWFGRDIDSFGVGILANLSRGGLALDSIVERRHLQVGRSVLIQFSPPYRDSYPGRSVIRTGQICWVEAGTEGSCRVAMQFDQSLWLDLSALGLIRG